MGRTKLTDKKKKKIIADYTNNHNYSETARMNKVSDNTVRNIVNNNPDVSKKFEQKKEENTQNILDYLDSIAEKQIEVINLSLKRMTDKLKKPDDYRYLNIKDVATAYGIIYDKALKSKELKLKNAELEKTKRDIEDLTTLADMLGFGKVK